MSDVVDHKLANGARVLVQSRSHLPLVSMAVATRGGSLFETRVQAGITALMGRASIKGTQRRSAAQIAEEAEAMGGSVSPSGGSDLIEWLISVPARHFESALELLCDTSAPERVESRDEDATSHQPVHTDFRVRSMSNRFSCMCTRMFSASSMMRLFE